MIYKLKDLGELKNGANYPKGSYGNGIKIVNVKDLFPSHFIQYDELKELDRNALKNPEQYSLNHGDILFTRSSLVQSGTGMCAMIDNPNEIIIFCGFIIRFRPDLNKINPYYLTYLLRSSKYRTMFVQFAAQTTITNLNQKSLGEIEVDIPELEYQNKIADILYVIDRKRKNNDSINRNLLEQAKSLYQSWFVDYEPFEGVQPDNWIVGTVDDLAKEIVCGKTPSTKKEEYYGEDMPFVTIPDMHDCVYAVTTARSLSDLGVESQKKKTLPKNSICVSCIGTAGLVVLLPRECQTNQQINSIIPKNDYSPYYIYLLMSTMSETINKLGQGGSTIVNLNKAQFGKMEVAVPSMKAMKEFDGIVKPLFETILSNQYENIKLVELRDSLLPKLMLGELDVSDVNI